MAAENTRLLVWLIIVSIAIVALGFWWFLSKTWNPAGYEIEFATDGREGGWTVHFVMMILVGGVLTIAVNIQRVLPFKRETNRIIHAILQAFVVVFVTIGFVMMYLIKKNIYSTTSGELMHFSNLHGQLGIILVSSFYIIALVTFLVVYILPLTPRLRIAIISLHRYFGMLLYLLAMSQIMMALLEKQQYDAHPPTECPPKSTPPPSVKGVSLQLALLLCVAISVGTTIYNVHYRGPISTVEPRSAESANLVDPTMPGGEGFKKF